MKNKKIISITAALLVMLTFSSCDKKEDGDRYPLFATLQNRMELVSGVAKDLKTGKETMLTGSDEFRLSFIFEEKNGYYVLNNVYVPFKWTTNEDKYYATLDFGSANQTRLYLERKAGEANPIITVTINNTEIKGNFRFLMVNVDANIYKDELTATWILNSEKGWIYDYDTDKKIPVDQVLGHENMVFKFQSGGKGSFPIISFDDDEPKFEVVNWKVSHDVLFIDRIGKGENFAMYIKELSKDKLILTSIDEDQYLDMTFSKKKE